MKLSKIPVGKISDGKAPFLKIQICASITEDIEVDVSDYTNPVLIESVAVSRNFGYGMSREELSKHKYKTPYTNNYTIAEEI
jgi:hypothetical protein